MVRGLLTICVAVAAAIWTAGPVLAECAAPLPGCPAEESSRFQPIRSSHRPHQYRRRTAYQPGTADEPNVTLPGGTLVPIPQGKPKRYSWTPRYGPRGTIESVKLEDGTERVSLLAAGSSMPPPIAARRLNWRPTTPCSGGAAGPEHTWRLSDTGRRQGRGRVLPEWQRDRADEVSEEPAAGLAGQGGLL